MGKAKKKWQIIFSILLIFFCSSIFSHLYAAKKILFVTAVINETTVFDDDNAIIQRMTQAGHEITLQSQDGCTAQDADGMDMVFISERVSAAKVASVYKEVPIPVICSEPFIFDDMEMASDVGSESDQNKIDIVTPGSSLAAGLSGSVTICNSGEYTTLNYGTPGNNATVVATVYGNSDRAVFFVYEKDETMENGFTAPAKRAAFFLFKDAALSLNDNGWKLFDSMLEWCFPTGSLLVDTHPQFSLYRTGNSAAFAILLKNNTMSSISIRSFSLNNNSFSLATSLPVNLSAGASKYLGIRVNGDGNGLYRSRSTIEYLTNGQTKTHQCEFVCGLFVNDDGETAFVADKAIDAYNACYSEDPSSVETLNNMGVLYRLLSESSIAQDTLAAATNKGINDKYGYAGVKMNYGVVKSDRNSSTYANNYYDLVLSDITGGESSSALAPQVYYNQGWEDYKNEKFSDALVHLQKVFSHTKSTDYVKAKAYILRGAIYFRQGYTSSANNAFEMAISLDPDGPIGRMAQENINNITAVEDENDDKTIPRLFTMMPNYPNPFNPSTTVSFALPNPCKVELTIFNVSGQKIRTILSQYMESGWHHASWDGKNDTGQDVSSGVYLLQMRAADFQASNKITLLR